MTLIIVGISGRLEIDPERFQVFNQSDARLDNISGYSICFFGDIRPFSAMLKVGFGQYAVGRVQIEMETLHNGILRISTFDVIAPFNICKAWFDTATIMKVESQLP